MFLMCAIVFIQDDEAAYLFVVVLCYVPDPVMATIFRNKTEMII